MSEDVTVHRRLSEQWVRLADFVDMDTAAEFLIKPLNSFKLMDVSNGLSYEDGRLLLSGRAAEFACKNGIKDWKHVVDEKGEDLPFSEKNLEWLPEEYLRPLSAKIYALSKLAENERKNS